MRFKKECSGGLILQTHINNTHLPFFVAQFGLGYQTEEENIGVRKGQMAAKVG